MSQFEIGEASVVIRPDLTGFRTKLEAELLAITRATKVPPIVIPVAAVGARAANAELEQLAAVLPIAERSARQTGAALLGAGTSSEKLSAGLLGLRTALGSQAVIGLGAASLAAIFLGKALRAAVGDAAGLESELNVFRETTGATADEMNAVASAARRLGADITLPSVSAVDAAEAMTGLAKAGLSVQDSIAGARGVLQLATAANISNAEAVTIASNALNAFGLNGDQAIRVADDLANAANAAQGSISDFGLALQQSSAVARQVGLSLEDTTALLTIFARNGLAGSDAGTSLRVALIRLVAPTKQAAGLIQSLGLNIRDAQGNVRPDIFAQFAQATQGLGANLRDAAAAAIFGQDAIRAVSIAGREGTRGLKLAQLQIDQQGTAARIAAARTEGLAGQFSALSSNAQTLGVSVGKLASGPLSDLLSKLNDIIGDFNALASGDFGDLFDIHTERGQRSIDTFQQRVQGLKDTFGGLRSAGQGEGFGTFTKGLGELIHNAKPATDAVQELTKRLNELQKLRISEFQAHIDIGPITAQIQKVRAELKAAGVAAGDIVPVTKLEKALAPLRAGLADARALRTELREQGRDTTIADTAVEQFIRRIHEVIRNGGDDVEKLGKQTAAAIQGNIQAAARIFLSDPTGPAADKALATIRRLLAQLKAQGEKDGTDAGKGVGAKVMAALAAAISGATPDVQEALRKALQVPPSVQQQLAKQASNLTVQALELDIAGGSDQQKIAQLNAQIANQRKIVDTFRKGSQEREDALQELDNLVNQRRGLEDQVAADAKEAADRAEQARAAAAQAMISLLSSRETQAEAQIGRAGSTRQLNRAVRAANEAARREFRAEVAEIRKTVDDAKTAAAQIAVLTAQFRQTLAKIRDDRRQQRDALRQQQQDALDQRLEALQIQIDTAGTTGNRARQRRLLNAEIDELERQIRGAKRGSIKRLQLIQSLREAQKELKDLKDEQKKVNNASAAAQFEFLQAQQGFAASLLGNLIPLGATGGLVGGTTGSAARTPFSSTAVAPPEKGAKIPAGLLGQAAVAAGKDIGPTRVGQSTELQLLREIRRLLSLIHAGNTHPEAHNRRRQNRTEMEIDHNL